MKLTMTVGVALAFAAALPAQAHTTSIGYVPGSAVGTVTFWTGSYEHFSSPSNEGVVALNGVSVSYSSSASFNLGPVTTKPAGLVDGTNNFFWGGYDGTRYPFPLSVDPQFLGGVSYWQGVTFTGLSAGTYDFGCGSTCGTTQQWASLNGAGDVIRLTLTAGDVNGGVPEPASWALMITGFGLTGATMRRRKLATAA